MGQLSATTGRTSTSAPSPSTPSLAANSRPQSPTREQKFWSAQKLRSRVALQDLQVLWTAVSVSGTRLPRGAIKGDVTDFGLYGMQQTRPILESRQFYW